MSAHGMEIATIIVPRRKNENEGEIMIKNDLLTIFCQK
jgi:hypothetical protein